MPTPSRIPLFVLISAVLMVAGCSGDVSAPPDPVPPIDESRAEFGNKPCHATGGVQIAWKGGPHTRTGMRGGSARFAEAVFNAHEPRNGRPAKGSFRYRVVSVEGRIHREIVAAVEGVHVDPTANKVWFIGRVTSDSKGCSGDPGGGHEGGCGGGGGGGGGNGGGNGGGGGGDDGGGCGGGEDDGHDGGCGGGGGGEDDGGGCGGGGEDDGGGCGGGGEDDGGGCGGGGEDDGGGCGGGGDDHGGAGGPRGASGRNCRVGQLILVKAHDGGSPGVPADGITWKWFLADDPDLPSIEDVTAWPHLCRKAITGGNLVIHVPGRPGGTDS